LTHQERQRRFGKGTRLVGRVAIGRHKRHKGAMTEMGPEPDRQLSSAVCDKLPFATTIAYNIQKPDRVLRSISSALRSQGGVDPPARAVPQYRSSRVRRPI